MGVDQPLLTEPEPLDDGHNCDDFSCGETTLDDWLKHRARKGNASGSARTFVICDGERRVVGYYALATGAVSHEHAPKKLRRNMPDPIPVIVLGRLAIDQRYQRHGLGQALMRDAILRILQASQQVGIAAILVHAISDQAREYYIRHGFLESPIDKMILCLPLATARKALV